ncbi:hypothetical protein, partial [Micromonospora sp. S4605]|uniref:hypothetical protein n=1 Tax=Micromonospora sp. S4605 TaxID=1420897 RepID=UPI001E5773D7
MGPSRRRAGRRPAAERARRTPADAVRRAGVDVGPGRGAPVRRVPGLLAVPGIVAIPGPGILAVPAVPALLGVPG